MRTRGGHLSLLPVRPLRCSPTICTCYDAWMRKVQYSLERLGDGKRMTPWPAASCMHTPCSGKLISRSRLVFPTSVISTCGVLSAAQELLHARQRYRDEKQGRPSPASSPPFPGGKTVFYFPLVCVSISIPNGCNTTALTIHPTN